MPRLPAALIIGDLDKGHVINIGDRNVTWINVIKEYLSSFQIWGLVMSSRCIAEVP